MHIMIVDDYKDARDVAEAMLLAAGYQDVRTVGSALEAYRLLAIGAPQTQESLPVDLVLLDILMPDIDGIEACARIRSESRHSDVPIIMVTSLGDTDSLANAFVAGATDYITKPLNRVELIARVRSALKLKSELDRRLARERELLQFVSNWDQRQAARWIDDTTGLFVGELAEAYLSAAGNFVSGVDTSVIALAIDRIDAYRATQGDAAAAGVMMRVARAMQATVATVGVVAAIRSNGVIVLVVPELRSSQALQLGEAFRAAVSKLHIANPEAIAADHVTASVAVVTGRVSRGPDRIDLLTRAISTVSRIAAAGGNRVMPEYI